MISFFIFSCKTTDSKNKELKKTIVINDSTLVIDASNPKKLKEKLEAVDFYNKGFSCSKKEDYTNAINLGLDIYQIYFNRGNLFSKKSNYNEAIKDFQEAIKLNPNNSDIYYNLTLVYINQKTFDKAIELDNKLKEIILQYKNSKKE